MNPAIITIKAEPSITLGDYARTVLPDCSPEHRRDQIHRLTLALARLLRVLHERSISDRDLKAANILIVGDPSAGEVELTLIDLVGVQLMHPLPDGRRLQNLARRRVIGRLLRPALLKPIRQAVRTGQGIGFQFAGQPVAPVGGNFEDRLLAAALGVTQHGVRRHGHGSIPQRLQNN